MKNNFINEIFVSVLLITLAVLLLNPFEFWMPDMLVSCLLALVVASFGLLATFIMKEVVVDEREAGHRMVAGRVAFLIGSATLTLGIVIQSLNHNVDFWLVIALVLMIIAKFGSLYYLDKRR